MGLLSKAVSNEVSIPPAGPEGLDEMGRALADRLLSLTRGESTPETAISLLKAYGSFRVGICLSLAKGVYAPYASVGTGDPVTLPSEQLIPVSGQSYYSVDYPPIKGSLPPDTKFWAFPLSIPEEQSPFQEQELPAHILLVGEDRNYIFQPGAVNSLLEASGEVFLPVPGLNPPNSAGVRFPSGTNNSQVNPPSHETAESIEIILEPPPEGSEEGEFAEYKPNEQEVPVSVMGKGGLLKRAAQHSPPPAEAEVQDSPFYSEKENSMLKGLSQGLEKFGSLHGLMFTLSNGDSTEQFAAMVSGFGTVSYVEPGHCLIFFDEQLDSELLSHHLLGILPGKKFFHFDAGNSREALRALKPYL
jgi:hypothetical protein